MKVLFQKPRWATATFRVSAVAVCVPATAANPINAATVRFMAFSSTVSRTRCARDTSLNPPYVLLAHHVAPARELIAQEFAEFRARHRRRRGAGLKELLAYVGRIQHGDDRVVQFRH